MALLSSVDSTPRAYRLKAGNAARKISTDAGDIPRTRGVRETLERLGVTVPEFPPYSPDLNLVEQPIGKLKAFLRKLGPRSWRSLMAGVRNGLKQFSPAECIAYLRHAGYGRPKRKAV